MYSSCIKYVLNIHTYWDLYTYIMDTSGCSHFVHCIESIYSSKLIQCHIITVALQSSRRLFPFPSRNQNPDIHGCPLYGGNPTIIYINVYFRRGPNAGYLMTNTAGRRRELPYSRKFSQIAAKGKFANKIFTAPRLKISIFL